MKLLQNLLTDISHTLGNNEKNMDEPADVVDVSAMEENADVVDVSAVRERSEETSPHPVKTASATPVSERDMSQSLPAASKEGVWACRLTKRDARALACTKRKFEASGGRAGCLASVSFVCLRLNVSSCIAQDKLMRQLRLQRRHQWVVPS